MYHATFLIVLIVITLNGDGGLNGRPGVVAFQRKVLVVKVKQILYVRVEVHLRQRARLARELQVHLLEVVEIDVCVARGVDELARLQAADLGYHHREERIGCNIERNAQECIRTALVELTGEFSISHVELEQAVARRQSHFIHFGRIPSGYQHSSRIRILFDSVDDTRKLINRFPVWSGPGTPLVSVNRTQVAILISPFIPNGYFVVLEILDVRIPRYEPKEFVDD